MAVEGVRGDVEPAKRTTAATMVAVMRELGHDRFAVVGHDRGALVAFRAALDHPDVISHLGVLDVVPTLDNWTALTGTAFVDTEHDQADRDAGRRLTMPVLAMWQDPGEVVLPFDPEQAWAAWAPDLRTHVLPCGHFLPEERPEDVTAAIRTLLAR